MITYSQVQDQGVIFHGGHCSACRVVYKKNKIKIFHDTWKLCEIQTTASMNKAIRPSCSFIFILSMAAFLITATSRFSGYSKTTCPKSLNYLLSGPLWRRFDSYSVSSQVFRDLTHILMNRQGSPDILSNPLTKKCRH